MFSAEYPPFVCTTATASFASVAASAAVAHIASAFGMPVLGTMSNNAGGGTIENKQIAAEAVTIGDLTVKQVFGITPWVNSDNPLSCVTENGLVGANVMSQGVWQIDYQAKTMLLSPNGFEVSDADADPNVLSRKMLEGNRAAKVLAPREAKVGERIPVAQLSPPDAARRGERR